MSFIFSKYLKTLLSRPTWSCFNPFDFESHADLTPWRCKQTTCICMPSNHKATRSFVEFSKYRYISKILRDCIPFAILQKAIQKEFDYKIVFSVFSSNVLPPYHPIGISENFWQRSKRDKNGGSNCRRTDSWFYSHRFYSSSSIDFERWENGILSKINFLKFLSQRKNFSSTQAMVFRQLSHLDSLIQSDCILSISERTGSFNPATL